MTDSRIPRDEGKMIYIIVHITKDESGVGKKTHEFTSEFDTDVDAILYAESILKTDGVVIVTRNHYGLGRDSFYAILGSTDAVPESNIHKAYRSVI